MSYYTRLASTDAQERAITAVEKAFKKANTNIGGATTIGKSPQTVIMDIYHHDGKIYINRDGVVKIENATFDDWGIDIENMSIKIKAIRDARRQRLTIN